MAGKSYGYGCCGKGWLPSETATATLLKREVRAHRDKAHGGQPGPNEDLLVHRGSEEPRPLSAAARLLLGL